LLRAGAADRTVLRAGDELLLAAGLLWRVALDDVFVERAGVDRACGVARAGVGVLFTVLAGAERVCVAGRLTVLLLLRSLRAGLADVLLVLRWEVDGAATVELLRCVRVELLRSAVVGRAFSDLTALVLVPRATDGRVTVEPFLCEAALAGLDVAFCSALEGRLLTTVFTSATLEGRLLLRVF